jgi:hypothetical protein
MYVCMYECMYLRFGGFCGVVEMVSVCPLAKSILKSLAEFLVKSLVKFLVKSLVRSVVESFVKSLVKPLA